MAAGDRSNELHLTRVYDAPVELVWAAWTDPAQVAQWWGPRGFSITTHSKDLRPGGTWVYTMHGPDGKDWPNHTRYLEVEEKARLVYDHGAKDSDAAPLFRVTVTFTPVDGARRTRMDLTMALATPEAAAQTRGFIKKAGGEGTWDRLAEHLIKRQTGDERFVIHRSFDAPVGRVRRMWSEHAARWLPPAGETPEVTFAEEGPERTRVQVSCRPAGTVSAEERAAFAARRPSMATAWTGALDRLEQLLDGTTAG